MIVPDAVRLRVDWSPCPAPVQPADLPDALIQLAREGGCVPGDVLVSALSPDGPSFDDIRTAVAGADTALSRDTVVTDLFSSRFGDAVMAALHSRPAHHTQLREFTLCGTPVLQLGIYPAPLVSHGVRLWCDPALIWLFVPADTSDRFRELLTKLQPAWERLRGHHGAPLDGELPEALRRLYPVLHRPTPLSPAAIAALESAIGLLSEHTAIQQLVAGRISPRSAVDATLNARRLLQSHLDRVDVTLEHSHGPARAKYTLLETWALELVDDTDETAIHHLLAPHLHLVMGFEETRANLATVAESAAQTATLITSAAVGRLLDRSDANRTASTAFAAAAFAVALVSCFTALASIPKVDRDVGDLVRLAGWIGAAGLLVGAGAFALARLAARPSATLPPLVRRQGVRAGAAVGAGAVLVFLVAGLVGSWVAVSIGALLTLGFVVMLAAANDY